MLTVRGRGVVIDDQSSLGGIFELQPEVEQRHDPGLTGSAAIIDVARIHSTSLKEPVLVVVK